MPHSERTRIFTPAEPFMTAPARLTYREVPGDALEEGEADSILELLRRAFNGGPSWFHLGVPPAAHLRWKVGDYPVGGAVELVEEGDRVVGTTLRQYHRLRFDGRERLGTQGMDLALDVTLQGISASSRWRAHRAKLFEAQGPHELIFGFAAHPTVIRGRGADAPTLGNELEALARPLRLRRIFGEALRPRGSRQAGVSRTRTALEQSSRSPSSVRAALGRLGFGVRAGVRCLTTRPRLRRGASYVRCWLPRSHPHLRLLARRGFLPYELAVTADIRPIGDGPEIVRIVEDPSTRFYVMMGDTDHL